MHDPRTLHSREVLARVHEAFGDQLLHTVIGRTVKFPDSSVAAEPITTYAPTHPGAWPTASSRVSWWPAAMPPDDGRCTCVGQVAFEVHLENFSGPFDLLLGPDRPAQAGHHRGGARPGHRRVHRRGPGRRGGRRARGTLGQISEFLVVAATLLDLKAARLLPRRAWTPREDLEMLEARDLLFARLLQYRAFKEVAADLGARLAAQARQLPRAVALEPHLAALLPELVLAVGPEQLARARGARPCAPRPVPAVSLSHLHAPAVSVREQAAVLVDRLRRAGTASFRSLVADAESTRVRGRALPGRARAVPGGGGRLRPGRPAGRAHRPLDRRPPRARSR